jgi:hypothetical protein
MYSLIGETDTKVAKLHDTADGRGHGRCPGPYRGGQRNHSHGIRYLRRKMIKAMLTGPLFR